MTKASAKGVRSDKSGASVAGRTVLGTTKDGVRILKPNGKATHFTQTELRRAVGFAMAAKQAG